MMTHEPDLIFLAMTSLRHLVAEVIIVVIWTLFSGFFFSCFRGIILQSASAEESSHFFNRICCHPVATHPVMILSAAVVRFVLPETAAARGN
jgi:hypothetical protein